MENKLNTAVVGFFVIFGIMGITLFTLWFTKFSFIDDNYKYCVVFKDSVSGLKEGALVRLKGVVVGNVYKISLKDNLDGVSVILKIPKTINIKKGVEAILDVNPVTGISTVQLISEKIYDEPLEITNSDGIPIIPTKKSFFQNISISAPDLIEKIDKLITGFNKIISNENIKLISDTISSINKISFELSNKKLITKTFHNINSSAQLLEKIIKENSSGLNSFTSSVLPALTKFLNEATDAADSLSRIANSLEKSPSRFLTNDTSQGYSLP